VGRGEDKVQAGRGLEGMAAMADRDVLAVCSGYVVSQGNADTPVSPLYIIYSIKILQIIIFLKFSYL